MGYETVLGKRGINGIEKYIFPVEGLGKKMYLALSVNAGSAMELKEEAGIAHFLEHVQMSFFETNSIEYFCSAHTDFYSTTYYFDLWEDTFSEIIRIIQKIILGDYIEQADMEKVRTDVMKEHTQYYKTHQEADFLWLLKGSEYEKHYSIGDKECIAMFQKSDLQAFYENHYYLDRMGIIWIAAPETLEKLGETWIDLLKGQRGPINKKVLNYNRKSTFIHRIGKEPVREKVYYFYREKTQEQDSLDEILLLIAEQYLTKQLGKVEIAKIYLSYTQEFIKIRMKAHMDWGKIYQLLQNLKFSEILTYYKEILDTDPIGYNCNSLREQLVQGFIFRDLPVINQNIVRDNIKETWQEILRICRQNTFVLLYGS